MKPRSSTARAASNIALVKYWGKADPAANLPATGSLSVTLSGMVTTTRVVFGNGRGDDKLELNGVDATETATARVSRLLGRIRNMAGISDRAVVKSENSFPTAAGLASSASGFAALTRAAVPAAGLTADLDELARIACSGSGSAPRSLLGGFVELVPAAPGEAAGCTVRQLAPPGRWDLHLVVAVCSGGSKQVSSTEGMEHSRRTSTFYQAWLDRHGRDLDEARVAVDERDLERLGRAAESSCFRMHAVALGANPPLLYWSPATLAVIHRVWALRSTGPRGWITIDAGPNVVVLCEARDAAVLADEIGEVPGVERTLVERPGSGAEVIA